MGDETVKLEFGLKPADYVAIVAYLVLTFGISIWFGRKQKNVDDYFVGGRRMPWFAVGLSILATLFSTLTYLGAPGELITYGVGLALGSLSAPLTACVVLLLWVPFFMRLRLTSAYEYLELRFGRKTRSVGAGLFILLRLGWMSMVTYAAAFALNTVKGPELNLFGIPDIYLFVALIGLVSAVYTTIGGIQALIWVDVLQCLLLLSGVLMAIGYVAYVDGTGPSTWWEVASASREGGLIPPFFSWDPTVRTTIVFTMVGNFFWTICTHGSDQVVLQRYFSTSSLKSARRSYLINLVVDLLMATLLAIAGLALLAFYTKHPSFRPNGFTSFQNNADGLFPHFLSSQLPLGCAGVIISAFLCDAIQTLESGVNAITAVVTNDFFHKPGESGESHDSVREEKRKLKIARVCSILISTFVTSAALGVSWLKQSQPNMTLVTMMPKFFNLVVGPLASLFFIGMFFPRCRARTALTAALGGLGVSILWSWSRELLGLERGLSPFLAVVAPYVTSIVLAGAFGLLFESGEDHPGRQYSWRSVMRRIPEPVDETTPA